MNKLSAFEYGYKHERGHSPGCQPKGFTDYSLEEDDKYYGSVIYDRELTPEELSTYDLEFIGGGHIKYKILGRKEACEKLEQLNVTNPEWHSNTYYYIIIEDKVIQVCRRNPVINPPEGLEKTFDSFVCENEGDNLPQKYERKIRSSSGNSILIIDKNYANDVFRLKYIDDKQSLRKFEFPVGPGEIDIINHVIYVNSRRYLRKLATYWRKYKKDQVKNTVTFNMYWEVCGEKTIELPDDVDVNNEKEVRQYINSIYHELSLPKETSYVGDSGSLDEETEIIINEKEEK